MKIRWIFVKEIPKVGYRKLFCGYGYHHDLVTFLYIYLYAGPFLGTNSPLRCALNGGTVDQPEQATIESLRMKTAVNL
jgi:hypothetical protein